MSEVQKPQGDVSAMASRYASAIAITHNNIMAGQTIALASAISAGLTLAAMVKPLPGFGTAIKFSDARVLLGQGLKASKSANDDFIERTLTAGRGFANWMFTKGRDLYASTFSAFDINDGESHAKAVQHVCNVLSADYGIRDRKAMASLWAKADVTKPAFDGVSRAINTLAKDELADMPARLAKAIVSQFDPATLSAFATAFAAENGAMLKLRQDAATAAATQGADLSTLAA